MQSAVEYAKWFGIATETGINFERLHQHLAEGVAKLLQHPRFSPDTHIWLSGSGDSLFAAQIAVPALERWTGFRGTVVSAMEFARYRTPLLTSNDVLWAISNSGSAARTRETVSLAKARGVLTVGVTGSETGPLAAAADTYIFRPVDDIPTIPSHNRGIFMNMNEFMVTLYSLYYVGLHLGSAKGTIARERVDEILAQSRTAIQSLGSLAQQHEAAIVQLAEELRAVDTLWTIGGGPSFGTARYCSAKFHEQIPLNGIPEDLEEWAHLQYFLTLRWKERSIVFVLAPPGNSLDRAEELVEGIAGVGGRAIVVAHPQHGAFPQAWRSFAVENIDDEFLAAFVYHLPEQMLILHLSRLEGVDPFALRRADGYKLIRHGVVLDSPQKLV